MKDRELNKLLKDGAVLLGLCDKWQDEWDIRSTKEELINKYIKGIDFCIKHDYPSKDFIKDCFPKYLLNSKGIFVDEKNGDSDDFSKAETVVLLGECRAAICYSSPCSKSVYIRHKSYADISVLGGAVAFIEMYDDSHLNLYTDMDSKAFVYLHGGSVESAGNVVVRDRRK